MSLYRLSIIKKIGSRRTECRGDFCSFGYFDVLQFPDNPFQSEKWILPAAVVSRGACGPAASGHRCSLDRSPFPVLGHRPSPLRRLFGSCAWLCISKLYVLTMCTEGKKEAVSSLRHVPSAGGNSGAAWLCLPWSVRRRTCHGFHKRS